MLKSEWKVDPQKTALVTIDLQRAFLEPESPVECAKARDFIPQVNILAELCRRIGIQVIHVGMSFRPDLSDVGILQEIRPRTDTEWETIEGRKGIEFYPGLHIDKKDRIIKKIRNSALISGSSNLRRLLQRLGKNTLIICGVATDVCIATTTTDAMMLGYRVFVVSDLTATLSEERQKIALEVLDRHFAKVIGLAELVRQLEILQAAANRVSIGE